MSLDKPIAAMRLFQIQDRSFGHNSSWIDLGMAHVIVALDVIEIAGFLNTRKLVDIAQIPPEVGVVHNPLDIAFEMDIIDWIKPK